MKRKLKAKRKPAKKDFVAEVTAERSKKNPRFPSLVAKAKKERKQATEVQQLKKELRKLKVRSDWHRQNAVGFEEKSDRAYALLRVIVPNARRWIETALQGPEPARERLLQWNLTESGILAAEAIIGRLQVAQPMREPPPEPTKEAAGYGRSGTATFAEVKPDAE